MSVTKISLAANVLQRTYGTAVLRRAATWNGVLILNYHRIGTPESGPFLQEAYSATAHEFDRQLAFLSKHADVIKGSDLPRVLASGRGRHVLLTFDDGYLDNYTLAYPILKQHGLTATFFICTGLLDNRQVAWWDEIAWIVRNSTRRELRGTPWFSETISLETDFETAFNAINERYRSLPGDQTTGFLDALGEAAGTGRVPKSLANDLWMSWDHVREMRASGMTIGAHTINHPILSRLSAQDQLAEVKGSRDRIAQEIGETPRLFAYPVGKPYTFNEHTHAALKQANFSYAFSFYGGHQPFAPVNRFDVRRATINRGVTLPIFQAKVALPSIFARW